MKEIFTHCTYSKLSWFKGEVLTVPLIKLLKAKEILSLLEVFVLTECINVDGNKIKSPFLTVTFKLL